MHKQYKVMTSLISNLGDFLVPIRCEGTTLKDTVLMYLPQLVLQLVHTIIIGQKTSL